MASKKYLTPKHSVRSTMTELEKLEKAHKSELRMISMVAFKFKSRYPKIEDPRRWHGETEASNVRMYETHFPGFCYQKDGKYRKIMSRQDNKNAELIESSEKVKALLFTDNELDIEKVICLHLLGSHVHNRRHIQRKDGRPCIFIKSQVHGNRRLSLQPISHKTSSTETDISSTYEKMLPRYVLEIRDMDRNPSNLSIRTYDTSSSTEDMGKWRKFQVPVYVNSDIRAIVCSVLEALEAVNSPKLKELINLTRNPEEMKILLSQEYIQEYIIELAGKQLINNANAYDFSITYPVFDKISDSATTEIIAQVLDVAGNSSLRNMLHLIRKNISRRYEELVLCNVIPGKKKLKEFGRGSMSSRLSRTSFLSGIPSTKTFSSEDGRGHEDIIRGTNFQNSSSSLLRRTSSKNIGSRTLLNVFPNCHTSERIVPFPTFKDQKNEENVGTLNNEEAGIHKSEGYQENEPCKYDLKSLNNSQRILLGLKVASMKSRPINMHQYENKKKLDIGSIIKSIVHPLVPDSDCGDLAGNHFNGLEQKKVKRPISGIGSDVENLGIITRGALTYFRHDIAKTENKRRVKEFMDTKL